MTVLAQLTKAERMLAEVRTAQEAEDVKRSAEAARVLAQQMRLGTASINHATAIKLKAELRLAAVVDEGRERGEIASQHHGGANVGDGIRAPDAAADLGIDIRRLHEAQVLARAVNDETVDRIVDAGNDADVVVSRTAVLNAARDASIHRLTQDGIAAAVVRRSRNTGDLEGARVEKAIRALDVLAALPTELYERVAQTAPREVLRQAGATIRAITNRR